MDAQPSLAPERPAHYLVSTRTDGEELSPVTLTLGSHGGLPSMRIRGLPPAPPPWSSAPHPTPLMVPAPPHAGACLTKDPKLAKKVGPAEHTPTLTSALPCL